MNDVVVKFKKKFPEAKSPKYANDFAAGFDLYATDDASISPGETATIDTGILFEIPTDYYIKLEEKSGISLRTGLILKAGVIDPDFRDSVKVVYYNSSKETCKFAAGEKIVQGRVDYRIVAGFQEEECLSETSRGTGGFNSTGSF